MSVHARTVRPGSAVRSALLTATLNSLVLDYAARTSVGGTHLALYILKQLPIPDPEQYNQPSPCDKTYKNLLIPRILELTYTSDELSGFAADLGYRGPPFVWNEARRHKLKSEIDGIIAHLYKLDRSELEWILDAPYPSVSFPILKKHEIEQHGEYRTKRYVLDAYQQLANGHEPNL